jgi:hypothetical protein
MGKMRWLDEINKMSGLGLTGKNLINTLSSDLLP